MVVKVVLYVGHHIVDDSSVYRGLKKQGSRVTSCTLSTEDSVQLTTILFDIFARRRRTAATGRAAGGSLVVGGDKVGAFYTSCPQGLDPTLGCRRTTSNELFPRTDHLLWNGAYVVTMNHPFHCSTTTMPWLRKFKEKAISRVHSRIGVKPFLLGLFLGFSLSLGAVGVLLHYEERKRRRRAVTLPDSTTRLIEVKDDEIVDGVAGLIGDMIISKIHHRL